MFKYGILLSIYIKTWYSENRFLGQLIQSGPIGRRLDYVEMRQEDKKKYFCGFRFDMTSFSFHQKGITTVSLLLEYTVV